MEGRKKNLHIILNDLKETVTAFAVNLEIFLYAMLEEKKLIPKGTIFCLLD